jgi:hypothetical protein
VNRRARIDLALSKNIMVNQMKRGQYLSISGFRNIQTIGNM